MIKSVKESAFWKRSLNWIWAESYAKPDASQKDCLFPGLLEQSHRRSPQVLGQRQASETLHRRQDGECAPC